jgi:mRNA interferase MazF
MPITYFPRAGEVLMCDLSGFKPPEMCKVRPVIIVSPRLPDRSEVYTIVPLSQTAPLRPNAFTVRLSRNYNLSDPDAPAPWAKCDMLLNISRSRLDRFKVGPRKWAGDVFVSKEDLEAVRQGVLHALGFVNLS